jgi:hypothetical protein
MCQHSITSRENVQRWQDLSSHFSPTTKTHTHTRIPLAIIRARVFDALPIELDVHLHGERGGRAHAAHGEEDEHLFGFRRPKVPDKVSRRRKRKHILSTCRMMMQRLPDIDQSQGRVKKSMVYDCKNK